MTTDQRKYPLECLLSSESSKCLPFAHTCDAFTFRGILKTRSLEPADCNVYEGEKLLYFFYGRPAYKKTLDASISLPAVWPVSLIIETQEVSTPKRVFPFDSGGFRSMYKDAIHPKMQLTDFELPPSLDAITRFVKGFWTDNESYFCARFKDGKQIGGTDFEAQAFRAICNVQLKTVGDDRRSAIEAQIDYPISLENGKILLVIAPASVGEEPSVAKELEDLGAYLETYEIIHGDPSWATILIYEKVRTFLKNKGYFA